MNIGGWTEVAAFTKHRRTGKLRDTFRIYTNELGWCKGRCDEKGKDFPFESVAALHKKIETLKSLNYQHKHGELPTAVVSRYAIDTEDI